MKKISLKILSNLNYEGTAQTGEGREIELVKKLSPPLEAPLRRKFFKHFVIYVGRDPSKRGRALKLNFLKIFSPSLGSLPVE